MISENIAKLADTLVKKGIKYAFGIAGSGSSLELITALEERGVPYQPVSHEAAAVFMAGACSRDGKTNAVAITIKGPGFANTVPGTLSNFYENRPALTASEAYGPGVPLFRAHKRMDHKSVISTIVKGFYSGSEPEGVEALLDSASSEVPKPVHIDLHNEPGKSELFIKEEKYSDESDLAKIKELINASKNPAIVLGSLAVRKLRNVDWGKIGVPVFTTAAGKGSIDENGPNAGGIITGEIKDLSPEATILTNADLIVSFGLRYAEVIVAAPFKAPLVNIDAAGGLADGFSPTINFVTSDPDSAASELIPILFKKKWGEDAITSARVELEKELFSDPWLPATLFRNFQKMFPDAALVLDTGFFCTVGETVWRARSPEFFLGSSVGRFMGSSIPTAIGFAISSDKRILSVSGDGGIVPYFPEIKIAVEKKLPILFLFMSDGGYGSVGLSGRAKGLSPRAFEFESSWWRAAETLGCKGAAIGSEKEFNDVIASWRKEAGPLFLETKFDPKKYGDMAKRLR
ncbi:hypothetical protein A3I27_02650 [Candidatus Giovannonibacteria bacterium RIFCSPLOWO2_02_FULL_43_11b]|uniref:Thiamine pyrophosphate-binding protein n=1 Tax=Candidatus Giovannonibacteria bacterium RIFCSPHIGHO2_12_FULL_43_15 TaxID=1798341 RepID=A0A1F5WNY8_9BACT|nr:MAG: hypothetical protein A2739_03330 [Candidatus Giovannonibacteria bacterium RIFCSPHIGHO2_01_FULL_43_100]OGF66295.1 MAG: hypothetical protein A3B97_01825 [Candidatus Giovannonibacteria bacterium RIFCSPHIGHO2_02_FULL_43_32]OGF77365.1 MAG: hypothetical protein A3F23_00245 [Candidatus Giovannonibacteria bacterium RIFCSPHIGHO2_12_FULL_43_15]OGF79188.1 MAG: hypothetical protein A3A15_01010 [Candidatus Giovannonibacteria bacterium RIFCSPLOWO2_01_FULL_43_60]OGF90538.1 MAG: hypothetical protein A3